jgi:hypothetical protein
MEELQYRLIERLRQDPGAFSRNKNFHAFEDPELVRARKIFRHLRAVERDLLAFGRAGGVTVSPEARGVRISVRLDAISGTRTAFLTAREFSLLLENPEIRALLSGPG